MAASEGVVRNAKAVLAGGGLVAAVGQRAGGERVCLLVESMGPPCGWDRVGGIRCVGIGKTSREGGHGVVGLGEDGVVKGESVGGGGRRGKGVRGGERGAGGECRGGIIEGREDVREALGKKEAGRMVGAKGGTEGRRKRDAVGETLGRGRLR